MKNELKLKNAVYPIIYLVCFLSMCLILLCLFGIVFTYFAEQERNFLNVYKIGGAILVIFWSIALISILFCKKIVITETEIRAYRWKKLKWVIPREQIKECIYTKSAWYKYIFPLESFNMFALQFKLYGKGN